MKHFGNLHIHYAYYVTVLGTSHQFIKSGVFVNQRFVKKSVYCIEKYCPKFFFFARSTKNKKYNFSNDIFFCLVFLKVSKKLYYVLHYMKLHQYSQYSLYGQIFMFGDFVPRYLGKLSVELPDVRILPRFQTSIRIDVQI